MAQKKAPAKRPTKAVAKKAPTKKVAPQAPTYDQLKAARDAADAAVDHVAVCIRGLNRAKSTQADFSVRDHEMAKATGELKEARFVAEEAQAQFEDLKRKAYLAR